MTRRCAIGITVLFAVGCAGMPPVETSLQLASRRDFPPSERALVWGRAVTAFQMTGRIVQLSDALGGVLQSARQGSKVPCVVHPSVASWCPAVEFSQFTVSNDGVAFLRITRSVRGVPAQGTESLVTAADRALQQAQVEDLLDFIVGKTRKRPEPPNPPLSAEPLRI